MIIVVCRLPRLHVHTRLQVRMIIIYNIIGFPNTDGNTVPVKTERRALRIVHIRQRLGKRHVLI